jgi:hypothetical protein
MKGVKENEQEGEEGFDGEGVYRSYNDVSGTIRCTCLVSLYFVVGYR